MSATRSEQPKSPWRDIFEKVRGAVAGRRDEDGVVGSINWLRKRMALRGANPNVVRNIIYRDKGRATDKRVLFDILSGLWEEAGNPALHVPELEALLQGGAAAEQEVAQLLGRDKRRAYRLFVTGVRAGEHPKLLVTGRPGSGKTVLIDYIRQALEGPPVPAEHVVRLEFSNPDLGASLARLADALAIPEALYEARLVKVGLSSAYAVQADAQADVARLLLDGVRRQADGLVLLLHVSRSLAGQDSLGTAQLRLNTEEVPRVSAAEWLWHSLLEPMSKLPQLSLLVTMAEAPARILNHLGGFEGPLKLAPPTPSEAKRFVRSKLPHLSAKLQDDIARQAGRSFEDLRILTLLAEVKEPHPQAGDLAPGSLEPGNLEPGSLEAESLIEDLTEDMTGGMTQDMEESLESRLELLSSLVDSADDPALRDFLGALAVLSLPEGPQFSASALEALGQEAWQEPASLARAFLDAVPTTSGETQWRPFSRQLGRALRRRLASKDPERYRRLHRQASLFYEPEALAQPGGEAATRYLQHLFEARDWQGLRGWMDRHSARQSLIRQIWQAARRELAGEDLEAVAYGVARYYVRLASYDHPEARAAFSLLAASPDADIRAWTRLKQAEGAIYKGRYEEAEARLDPEPEVQDPVLKADLALARANLARWRGELARAARCIERARPLLGPAEAAEGGARALVRAKIAVWGGLVAKDRGELEEALAHFGRVESDDGLVRARQAFQQGDVLARLGRFDGALEALSLAVHLAEDCEAPVQERSRYLARRARILRKQGKPAGAEGDFAASLALLSEGSESGGLSELERAFERAKVHDERALNLLALGHHDEAVLQLQDNLLVFARYERDCRVDASFRILRGKVRLSLAYWARETAQPYAAPFLRLGGGAGADLEQAQRLVERVRGQVAADPDRNERYGPLYTQTLLVASLVAADAGRAVAYAEEAHAEARFPYQRALHGAYWAAALLRAGQPARAAIVALSAQADHAQAVHARTWPGSEHGEERGDTGLLAWLVDLGIRAQLAGLPGFAAAADSLSAALQRPELASHHESLLRAFGEAAAAVSPADWAGHPGLRLLGLEPSFPADESVRLPDALVARWRASRAGRPPVVAAD